MNAQHECFPAAVTRFSATIAEDAETQGGY